MGFAFRFQGSRAKRGLPPSISTPFVDVTGQALNTVITSNTVQVLNISGGSSIMITGGAALGIGNGTSVEYSINGGTFTSSSGVIDPTDQLQLRITTHALFLGDLSQVKVTVAGVNFLWNVTSTAPAPAMSSVRLGFGSAAMYQATRGGTPAITELVTSFNTGTSSTTLENQSSAHAMKNFFTNTGSTSNSFAWPAGQGNAIIPIVGGTLTNAMYSPDDYIFTVECKVDFETGGNADLANVQWADDYLGQPAEFDPPKQFNLNLTDWVRGAITSNSQAVSLYPTFNTATNSNNFGPTVGNHADSAQYSVFHDGHPSPTTAGSTGQTGNYILGIFSLIFFVIKRSDSSQVHHAPVHEDTIIQIMPA